MTQIRASVTPTDFRNLIERGREALTLPVDRDSRRAMSPVFRELEELFNQGMGHPGGRDCPDRVCPHRYVSDPWRELKMAKLGREMADAIDNARFHYRWKQGEDPTRGPEAVRKYRARRPHIATLIRSISKQIDHSARAAIRAA